MLLAVLLIGNTSSFPISSYSSPALATIEKFVKIVNLFSTEHPREDNQDLYSCDITTHTHVHICAHARAHAHSHRHTSAQADKHLNFGGRFSSRMREKFLISADKLNGCKLMVKLGRFSLLEFCISVSKLNL